MRVLVVGGDSVIGHLLALDLRRRGYAVWSTTRRSELVNSERPYLNLEYVSPNNIPLPDIYFDFAILCSAITSISFCEDYPIETYRINVTANELISKRLIQNGSHIIFLSSSSVFDRSILSPTTTDTPNPQCEYGRQKLILENKLTITNSQVAILRLTKVADKNFPLFTQWINNFRTNRLVEPFFDVHVAPMSVKYCVALICHLLQSKSHGLFHGAPQFPITYAEVANYIASATGASKQLVRPRSGRAFGVIFKQGAMLGGNLSNSLIPPPPNPYSVIDEIVNFSRC
jgi:dTDP-4-dehydrorhamnose reductase